MPRYIIELTSANPCCPTQVDYEASDEAEAIRHYLSHNSGELHGLLVDREGEQYRGWKKIEISIGPGVCEQCFEPSEPEVCADCVENDESICQDDDHCNCGCNALV